MPVSRVDSSGFPGSATFLASWISEGTVVFLQLGVKCMMQTMLRLFTFSPL